jgi:putative phosphoserine phosphatase/1-acylglycerol-3-phosphate O-acyltransferase
MMAAMGAMNIGFGVAVGLGLLRRDRRTTADLSSALGLETFLAMLGVKVNVIGEHNLWAARPAVFIMNHQSTLDAIIVGALLRRDFASIAKREGKYDPRTFLMGQAMRVVFIDRSNSESARESLKGAVQLLRDGTSIIIAPEGTRTRSPLLLPFKKGGFHLAREAGVPVVPVVLRNPGELVSPNGSGIYAGTVDVRVHEPIPTDDWTVENIGEHVTRIQQLVADTLEHWPGEDLR